MHDLTSKCVGLLNLQEAAWKRALTAWLDSQNDPVLVRASIEEAIRSKEISVTAEGTIPTPSTPATESITPRVWTSPNTPSVGGSNLPTPVVTAMIGDDDSPRPPPVLHAASSTSPSVGAAITRPLFTAYSHPSPTPRSAQEVQHLFESWVKRLWGMHSNGMLTRDMYEGMVRDMFTQVALPSTFHK
jgi:hypothetical protein